MQHSCSHFFWVSQFLLHFARRPDFCFWNKPHDCVHIIDCSVTFPFQWLDSIQWYSWSATDPPPAVQVGISAGAPHASLTTCSLCQLAQGPGRRSKTLNCLTGWENTQVKNPCRAMTHKHTFMNGYNTTAHVHTLTCSSDRTHTHTFACSDTPVRIICLGRGSGGMRQWTAFEPVTSVTHPYWWQAEHSLQPSTSASIAWPQGLQASVGWGWVKALTDSEEYSQFARCNKERERIYSVLERFSK